MGRNRCRAVGVMLVASLALVLMASVASAKAPTKVEDRQRRLLERVDPVRVANQPLRRFRRNTYKIQRIRST